MLKRLCLISVMFIFLVIGVMVICQTSKEGYKQSSNTFPKSKWSLQKQEITDLQRTKWSVQTQETTEEDGFSFTTNISLHFITKDRAEYRLKIYLTNNPKMIVENQVKQLKYKYNSKTKSGTLDKHTKFHINQLGKLVISDDEEEYVLTRN